MDDGEDVVILTDPPKASKTERSDKRKKRKAKEPEVRLHPYLILSPNSSPQIGPSYSLDTNAEGTKRARVEVSLIDTHEETDCMSLSPFHLI
jgi:hypothetical protein